MKQMKEYCNRQKQLIKKEIENVGAKISLAIIQVGDNEASNRYVRNKMKDCAEVGITAHRYFYEEWISTEELELEIKDLCQHYNGVIVQLPLPKHIDEERIKLAVDPYVDVDGFHPMSTFIPCTAAGIIDYLNDRQWEIKGKNIVVIGRSDIVGKPLARELTNNDATVTLCHSKTKDLKPYLDMADLVIVAVGKRNFLDCSTIDCPVIDVGINFTEEGKLCGDCYNIKGKNVSPVPGGVGLLTRIALIKNTCKNIINF